MTRLLLGILLVLASCQNEASENASVNNVETSSIETKTISNYQCVAKVQGMVCKMGCGGAIRKGLTSLEGVNRVVIDFDEAREEQFVTVLFNADFQDEKAIYAKLESVNNGQFVVGETKSEAIKNPS
jgi:copper chaperone CopZ